VAGPAKRFEVRRVVGAAIRFGYDVIDSLCRSDLAIAFVVLTEVLVACQHFSPEHVPLPAVTALVAALPALMLLPALIAVLLAVT